MDLNEKYNLLNFIANKNQRGYITPSEFNNIADAVNIQLAKEYFGLPEEYQPGSPVPKISYQITQLVSDYMSPFRKEIPVNVDTQGHLIYPDNYIHFIAGRYPYADGYTTDVSGNKVPVYTESPLEMIDDDKESYRAFQTKIAIPTIEDPICITKDTYIQIYPKNLGNVILVYLRYPIKPLWAYTLVNDRPVYNSSGSTDFEWKHILDVDIVRRMASYVGINLRDQQMSQYVESKINQGK